MHGLVNKHPARISNPLTPNMRLKSLKLEMLAIALGAASLAQITTVLLLTMFNVTANDEQAEMRAVAILQSRAEIISGLVWRFQYNELDKVARDLILDTEISHIEVYDAADQLVNQYSDPGPLKEGQKKSVPLFYKDSIVQGSAGRIDAVISREPFLVRYGPRLIEAMLLALFSSAAITIAIWTAMSRLVNRPLDLLLDAITESRRSGATLHVDWKRNDEIGTVISAFNALQGANERAQREILLASANMQRLSEVDDLTGLFNRRAAQRAVRTLRHTGAIAIHFVDLDEFKLVNDTLGHGAGDMLLMAIGAHMNALNSQTATFFRMGGDEFVALQTDVASPQEAMAFAETIHQKLCQSYSLGNTFHPQKVSIGTFFAADGVDNSDELFGLADIALYEAKRRGRNRVFLLTEEIRRKADDQSVLEKDLADAVRLKDLHINFQPQFDLKTGDVVGFEVLSRWSHPARGDISPVVFIPMIEALGLSNAHGATVLRMSCHAAATIQRLYGRAYTFAINVNAEQLLRPGFIPFIKSEIVEHGLSPSQIEIEITESVLVESFKQTNEVINELHDAGISVAIDDFGTGYSSLSYLSKLNVDRIKIDRSFVSQLSSDSTTRAVIELIAGVAKTLSLTVVAEGVEKDWEEKILRGCGIQYVQGFMYARPMSLEALIKFLERSNAPRAANVTTLKA